MRRAAPPAAGTSRGRPASARRPRARRRPARRRPPTPLRPVSAPTSDLAADPAGFSLAVPAGWQRHGGNAQGQIRYTGGHYAMTIVPGRDSVADFGGDPLTYQSDQEPGTRRLPRLRLVLRLRARNLALGGNSAAEGGYTWRDTAGRQIYARNLAVVIDGRYHVILVTGPRPTAPRSSGTSRRRRRRIRRPADRRSLDRRRPNHCPVGPPRTGSYHRRRARWRASHPAAAQLQQRHRERRPRPAQRVAVVAEDVHLAGEVHPAAPGVDRASWMSAETAIRSWTSR